MRNIKIAGNRYHAYVKVGTAQRFRRYPLDTKIDTIRNWIDETRLALRKLPRAPAKKDTLKADARLYLARAEIRALASYKSRVCEIEAWYPALGDRPRDAITRADVEQQRGAWLDAGVAPKTINHRTRALRHLYRVLDGSRAATPCDDIPKLKEPPPNPQFVPVRKIREVASKLKDPKTRARFMVLAATGQRPAQLKRAVRIDVNLRKRIWMVRPAKGGNPIPVFLTSDMLAAWRAFIAADAWGAFDGSDYAKQLYAAGWPRHIPPYNAKHTVAITLAESDAEWEDIRDWFGQTDIKTTRIYTGVVLKRLKSTARKLEGRIGWR